MQPLRCNDCMAQVLVKKNSWEHTEVQWDQRSRQQCREFGGRGGDVPASGCTGADLPSMLATITRAAADGLIDVLDDAPVPAPIVQ